MSVKYRKYFLINKPVRFSGNVAGFGLNEDSAQAVS
jgi:hypothetical protein